MSKPSRGDAIARLSMVSADDATPPAPPAPAPAAPAATPRAKPGKPARQHTSIYLPVPAYERLREIAFKRRVNMNAVLIEAINAYLVAEGHSDAVEP